MSKEVLTKRPDITAFLSQLLITTRLSGIGKHYASEVTLDYGHKKGEPKRIDFVQFKPQELFLLQAVWEAPHAVRKEKDQGGHTMTSNEYQYLESDEEYGCEVIGNIHDNPELLEVKL